MAPFYQYGKLTRVPRDRTQHFSAPHLPSLFDWFRLPPASRSGHAKPRPRREPLVRDAGINQHTALHIYMIEACEGMCQVELASAPETSYHGLGQDAQLDRLIRQLVRHVLIGRTRSHEALHGITLRIGPTGSQNARQLPL